MKELDIEDVTNAVFKYDKEVNLAIATSRRSKRWKNKLFKISDFVKRLSITKRTDETIDEYFSLPRSEQDEIKDSNGAFVGASLKNGRRRKQDVANRTCITTDLDFATPNTLDLIKSKLSGISHTVYSTHKNTTKKPRYRLIVWADRAMLPDEHQAVVRKLAETIDIELFDTTGFDANRLYYFPTTSVDGEYIFYHNDQPFLKVDDILDEYGPNEEWKSANLWPRSTRETKDFERLLKKQQNPLEKQGIVGALCRVVSIYDALNKHLGDVYKRESEDRYTYIDGTSTNGVVVYEDAFVYSNHESDPISHKSCNAFDLIRIHKFGHEDEDVTERTPINRMPSYLAMSDWAMGIESVKVEMAKSNITVSEFDAFDENPADDNWVGELEMTTTGLFKPTFLNATIIVGNDPALNNQMRYNMFTYSMERKGGKSWMEEDSLMVRKHVGRNYGIDFPEGKIEKAIDDRGFVNKHHPVRNYLYGLKWDGTERAETLFIDYFGCEDNIYVREVALCWLVAAVSRIMEPGFKFDTSPVISGAQGIGKTSFIRELGKRKWYGELSSFDPKVAVEEISGKWIIEINEMGATNKQALEQQKSFLSGTHTRTRLAYDRRAADYDRQCVFFGSTNEDTYLKDSTGNRRWWPLDASSNIGFIDVKKLRSEVDQIWAEAMVLYSQGREVFLTKEALKIALKVQEDKIEEDPWRGKIEEWLSENAPIDRYDSSLGSFEPNITGVRDVVCVQEILDDCFDLKRESKPYERKRIARIISAIDGWKSVSLIRFGTRYGRQRGWRKDSEDIPF